MVVVAVDVGDVVTVVVVVVIVVVVVVVVVTVVAVAVVVVVVVVSVVDVVDSLQPVKPSMLTAECSRALISRAAVGQLPSPTRSNDPTHLIWSCDASVDGSVTAASAVSASVSVPAVSAHFEASGTTNKSVCPKNLLSWQPSFAAAHVPQVSRKVAGHNAAYVAESS